MKIEEKLAAMDTVLKVTQSAGAEAIGMLGALVDHKLVPKHHEKQAKEILKRYDDGMKKYLQLQQEAAEIEL